jgi:hypothetical protein
MKIEVYKPEDALKRGNFCLWYGKSGVGKSGTLIQTCADPILWIIAERGQIDLTIKAINRPDLKLLTAYYDGWDDLLEMVYNRENFKGVKSVVFDGLTHVMNIHLSDEILDENYDAMDKKKIEKDLTMRVKMSPESYGALSKQMSRLMKGFEQLTVMGIDVHCTARDDSQPKWDRTLACAPALAGREFPRDMKGFFDFIGMIETNIDKDGKVVYPPLVSCDDDGSFLSKWTGVKPTGGVIRKPFNVQKLLAVAHGDIAKKGGSKEDNDTENKQ